jgi:hypothetical protein
MRGGAALRSFFGRASLRELLLWCLPALMCGGLARGLLLAHFPYGYVHPDSPDFLVTADRFLFHHRFVLHGKKAFLAPILFLLPMLVKIPCLLIIPWAQHLFGLIYTVMVGAIVRCWTVFWRWWIVPATMLATLNPAVLYYEHALIAESQYLWCVTALVLAGSAYALEQTRGRFILLLLALLLTAGSRPEGKLYVLFCLLLVPMLHWGQWRKLAIFGVITLAFSILTWMSTRNTQAGVLLYATLLPLAPETPKSAPDFGPVIAPLRNERLARGALAMPDFVREEKSITGVLYPYLESKGISTNTAGAFCQRLAVEAALHRPLLLPLVALDKFLLGTTFPTNEGFGIHWLQDIQIDSCTFKPWMLELMPLMTGRPISTKDDLVDYVKKEFPPIQPDWFSGLQRAWLLGTTGARIPLRGALAGVPGVPLFYLLGAAGMVAGLIRPGAMRKVHIAWIITLGFTALVVMLTGVVNPRYRFVFEPFALLYVFVLVDGILALAMRRAPAAGPIAEIAGQETPAPALPEGPRPAVWPRIAGYVLTAGYLAAAAALLYWGALRRFELPQAPLIDPDIEGYLGPAISALAGKGFVHLVGRSFPYPGFVYLILRIFGDFRAIAVVQHSLGVAAGGLILLAWNAAGDLVPQGGIPKPLVRFMGLVPAYLFLGSATAISFEHQIRPEAIFPFLAILNIWLSFRFLEARFIRKGPSFLWLGALNVFVSCLIYMAKPSFGFATLLCTLPVWLSLLLPGASTRQKVFLAAAGILPALLLLFLPEHILKARDPWAPLFLPETLFTVHADVIERQMDADRVGNGALAYGDVVQASRDLLAAELAKASQVSMPKTYPSLGFNPDYLMYDDSFCTKWAAEMHFSAREMGKFCMAWYLRALWYHPGEMAGKAKRQLAIFYTSKNPVYWLGKSMDLSNLEYARVARLMPLTSALGPGNPAVERYIASCNQLAGQGVAIPQARRFIEWLRLFSAHYLDLMWVALLSPLLLFFRPLRAHFLWLVVALWLAYSYNFGNCLTIAVVHSLEVTRYVRIQLIFTLFAQCLSLYLLLELAAFGLRAGIAKIATRKQTDNTHHGAARTSQ